MLAGMKRRPDELFGLPVKDIVRIARVDPSTARRWKRGATPVPAGILLLLAGDLGCFDPEWSGWVLRRGKLISPEGFEATPGHVRGIRFHVSVLATYRGENQALRAALESYENAVPQLEDQPEPASWEYRTG